MCTIMYTCVHTLCFRRACMFGIMSGSFFLQTLAFPSLWSIKSVHKTLSQNFWGSSPILLANEWFASSGVASVLLFMESSANSRLWYLHFCPLEVVADVTNSCFRVFLYSCHNVSVVNCFLPQEIPNGCTCYCQYLCNGLIDFSSSLSFTIARFSPIDTSLVFMLVTRLTNYKCSLHGSETERRHSVLFIVWIFN